MKIIALQNKDYSLGEIIVVKEPNLIVEMTQEEYQKCCVALYKDNKPLEKNYLKGMK